MTWPYSASSPSWSPPSCSPERPPQDGSPRTHDRCIGPTPCRFFRIGPVGIGQAILLAEDDEADPEQTAAALAEARYRSIPPCTGRHGRRQTESRSWRSPPCSIWRGHPRRAQQRRHRPRPGDSRRRPRAGPRPSGGRPHRISGRGNAANPADRGERRVHRDRVPVHRGAPRTRIALLFYRRRAKAQLREEPSGWTPASRPTAPSRRRRTT